MNDEQKKYRDMQRKYYDEQSENMLKFNHGGHCKNPDYATTLLQSCHDDISWKDAKIFEFGCGCGRNILWLLDHARWCQEVSGCDISANNIANTRELLEPEGWWRGGSIVPLNPPHTELYVSSGMDCGSAPSNHYDMVFSTIVLQHICVHSIRYSIMEDVHRILVPGGLFSFQMGFDGELESTPPPYPSRVGLVHTHEPCGVKVDAQALYHEDNTDAIATNSSADVRITDPQEVIADLEKIGFKDVTHKITNAWQDDAHRYWIWFQARRA